MQRAFDLARKGLGAVSPNPMVGSVIVHDDTIIGEGWHRRFGEAHAEVHAINSVEDQVLLTESTVYVTLEPCAHFGKTPPCANLLVEKRVKKVVISNVDPNPQVAGRGISILEEAGIEVQTGILEERGRTLNQRFFTALEKNRPYIILKWAQTQDGFIARENYDSKWISDARSRKLVHKWRSDEDAIMVGANTAHFDNPKLNVRDWIGSDPVRVVLDPNLRLSPELHLFDGSIPTLCYNSKETHEQHNLKRIKLDSENFLTASLEDLCKRNLHSLIVEGGGRLLSSFLKEDLWDEARVFVSETEFGSGIAAPTIEADPNHEEVLINDRMLTYYAFRKT